jgi:hypothetical protein
MGLHNRFPIVEWISERITEANYEGFNLGHYQSKKPDGLLHPSSHLGCEFEMCHTMDPDIGPKKMDQPQLTTLLVGTLMHNFLQAAWESSEWEGLEARCEQKMAAGLPKGWQGTADLLLGQFGDGKLSEAEWTLFDYKTIKGANVAYIDLDNPKPGQHMQASAYWHAAAKLGYKMMPELCIVHIPVSAAPWKQVEPPIAQWLKPLPVEKVFGEMRRRSRVLKAYLELTHGGGTYDPELLPKKQPLVQTQKYNKKTKQTEVTEGPNWLVSYCNSPVCVCKAEKRVIAYLDDDGGSL